MLPTLHGCVRDSVLDSVANGHGYLPSTERVEKSLALNLGCNVDCIDQFLVGRHPIDIYPDAQTAPGLLVPVLLDEVRVDACNLVGVLHEFGVSAPKLALEVHIDGRTATEVHPPASVCENAQPPIDGPASHRQRIAASRLAAPKAQQHEVFIDEPVQPRAE
jgi:hypothetical protein